MVLVNLYRHLRKHARCRIVISTEGRNLSSSPPILATSQNFPGDCCVLDLARSRSECKKSRPGQRMKVEGTPRHKESELSFRPEGEIFLQSLQTG